MISLEYQFGLDRVLFEKIVEFIIKMYGNISLFPLNKVNIIGGMYYLGPRRDEPTRNVTQIIYHPNYSRNEAKKDNNVAILIVRTPV